VRVGVAAEDPFNATLVWEKLHVTSSGRSPQANVTVELNPARGEMFSIKVADWPAFTDAVDGDAVTLKSVPTPRSAIDCGLAPALSVIVMPPAFLPVTAGENVTSIVQFAPGATVEFTQVSVSPKLPLAVTPVIFKSAFPPLVTVTA
jgi:hypothetical protein